MVTIKIGKNEEGQRLDRFLKKYLNKASLSTIYKLIRKDVKINAKRAKESSMLAEGDELTLYISDETMAGLRKAKDHAHAKRQFRIAYEDEDILIAEKPFGLLTHGDHTEKKNHLANQVVDYLISTGAYNPRTERTFVPAPCNRLDRNTTGLVIFGKNAAAMKRLNEAIRERDSIRKIYLTIVAGHLDRVLDLEQSQVKDERRNVVRVVGDGSKQTAAGERGTAADRAAADGCVTCGVKSKTMHSIATPIEWASFGGQDYTLVEVEIKTGRTHQIRVQLAAAGYPIIGDIKYGNRDVNRRVEKAFGITTQLLHAYRLELAGFGSELGGQCSAGETSGRADDVVDELGGQHEASEPLVVTAQLPASFKMIKDKIFGQR